MATIVFYEKPGCINNTKQKELLRKGGHTVVERNLLNYPWTADELRPFFGRLPSVAHWFNPSAPRIKKGEVCPAVIDADQAIEMMLEDPYLIRRPLMESGGQRHCGFDPATVHAWVGLGREFNLSENISCCPNPSPASKSCP
jgi:nitrogenase-associated protein